MDAEGHHRELYCQNGNMIANDGTSGTEKEVRGIWTSGVTSARLFLFVDNTSVYRYNIS